MELYLTIETGGSIGENARGHFRQAGKLYTNKEAAKKHTKWMSSKWGGGYYDYHYTTKTLKWAIKNNVHITDNEVLDV